MAGMTDMLEQLLGGQADRIGSRIGADESQTRSALSLAIPSIIAALGNEEGAGTGLKQAVEQDHDGSILDDLTGYLDGTANLSPRTTNGAGILEHALGDRQANVERSLSSKTGLSMDSIGQLLPILAPIVMGMLGKQSRSAAGGSGGGGFGLDDLGGLLGGETAAAQARNPDLSDILGSLGGLGGGGSTRTSSSPPAGSGELSDRLGSLNDRKPGA